MQYWILKFLSIIVCCDDFFGASVLQLVVIAFVNFFGLVMDELVVIRGI